MRIAAISDVHNNWHKVNFKPADILIIAGDMTNDGWKHEFNDMFDILSLYKNSYEEIIVVAGNHDGKLFERTQNGKNWFKKELNTALGGKGIYLEHESIDVMGLKVFGSPFVNNYCQIGFNRNDEDRERLWKKIPKDTDILVTHMPPYGILDTIPDDSFINGQIVKRDISVGCQHLRKELGDFPQLKAHIFGHIHPCGGRKINIDETAFLNVAACDMVVLDL